MKIDRSLILEKVRKRMQKDNLDALIIPSSDPHISEYLPECYRYIGWLSGFSGSAGTLVVTDKFAGLWTDSRYFVQAETELSPEWELVPLQVQNSPEYIGWLLSEMPHAACIAYDHQLMPLVLDKEIKVKAQMKGIHVKHSELLNDLWDDRPSLPVHKAFCIPDKTTGESATDKIARVRTAIQQEGASYHLLSSLDDIAWLFNIRGADVSYNPVVLAFVLIGQEEAILFADADKFKKADLQQLKLSGISIQPYSSLQLKLSQLASGAVLLVDPNKTAAGTLSCLHCDLRIIEAMNPSTRFKSRKNKVEIDHIVNAMRKDGIALVRFLKWLEKEVPKGSVTEISAARKLFDLRSQNEGFVSNSFATISAYAASAALPHYKPNVENDITLKDSGLYLVDSGGQYLDGTTDVTRVVPLGRISHEEMQDYTLVLKAMIDGCSAVFPKGTRGYQIDAITRKALWDHCRDYGHGTGHGVGFFLNVHEGPQVFNKNNIAVEIEEGMITSIEPGIYRPGKYGIRIENLVLTFSYERNEFAEFYAFETLTLVPIDTRPVIKGMLEKYQIEWLNRYNKNVYEFLSPELSDEDKGWLRKKTMEI